MNIGARLSVSFAIVVALIVCMAAFGLIKLALMEQQIEYLATGNAVKLMASSDSTNAIQSVYRSIDLMVMEDKSDHARTVEKEKLEAARARYRAAIKILDEKEKSDQGKQIIEKVKQALAAAATTNNRVIELALAGKGNEAHDLMVKEANPLYTPIFTAFAELDAYQKAQIESRHNSAITCYQAARNGFITILVIAVLVALLCAFLISRSITRPLSGMLTMLKDIAQGEGDLTKRLDASAQDELGEVSRWFNQFIEKLNSIIGQVALTTSQVAAGGSQVHTASVQMATGAEQMASQSGTIATASEEMAATSGDIARNCGSAAEASQQANQMAVAGSQVVEATVAIMNQISDRVKSTSVTIQSLGTRSDQIGEIIGTIEDIADQTNLLALNAAIEAARAGEQGRGFAVVADEVRALAERTTRATKEIGEMIKAIQSETGTAVTAMDESVRKVEQGRTEAAKSGEAIQSVLQQINEVSMQVNQIATAAEEQTATTSEISRNMLEITDVVQHTARGAHESAAAATELNYVAESLKRLVGQFKLA